MRVLYVVHAFPPERASATERTVEELARAMQAAGHDVTVLAGTLELGDPKAVRETEQDGLRVLRMPRNDLYFESWYKSYAPEVSASFAALLGRENPGLVHVHHWLRLTSDPVRLARAAGCATAVTLHDYFALRGDPVRRYDHEEPIAPPLPEFIGAAEARELFDFHRRDLLADVQAADVRSAPSNAHAAGVQKLAGGPLGEIAITPPSALARPPRIQPRAPRGHRLVTWGSWYRERGLETIFDAMRRLDESWSLDVYGEIHDVGYRVWLRAAADGLAVRFHGAIGTEQLGSIDADYTVLPTLCHESYAFALDEAMALGLPILASDLPVFRERAQPEAMAFFAPGDAAHLAAVLQSDLTRWLVAPDPPPEMSAADAARSHEALYRRALRGEPGPIPDRTVIDERERSIQLFRRAERRLWTALQQPEPPAPPDDFLGPKQPPE